MELYFTCWILYFTNVLREISENLEGGELVNEPHYKIEGSRNQYRPSWVWEKYDSKYDYEYDYDYLLDNLPIYYYILSINYIL